MKIRNPFDHSSKLLFSLSLVWAAVLLLIGVWWIYLIFNFENILLHADRKSITKMIIWEGGSFLVLLLLLSISLLLLYLKDQRKTKSLQAFFASLTHELKTPLASIRLQGEVINEILSAKNDTTLNKLSSRLIEDTGKLETQMDKILQLSRIERGGGLNLTSLKIIPFIKNLSKKWASGLSIDIESDDMEASIVADEFALELIIKNLFENTRIHTKSQNVKIKIQQTDKNVLLTYQDKGEFSGDKNKLGTLFYKHNSSKGSGIGLYLTNKLLEKMRGKLRIDINEAKNLIFFLTFKRSEDLHA
ncbi:MAG: HAMP domain-containing sensor histidine kinase [Bacteriovorax sp.]|nr:HAMP domain-containing sensor histidine kinase [Bacteriovorax sp.]